MKEEIKEILDKYSKKHGNMNFVSDAARKHLAEFIDKELFNKRVGETKKKIQELQKESNKVFSKLINTLNVPEDPNNAKYDWLFDYCYNVDTNDSFDEHLKKYKINNPFINE